MTDQEREARITILLETSDQALVVSAPADDLGEDAERGGRLAGVVLALLAAAAIVGLIAWIAGS